MAPISYPPKGRQQFAINGEGSFSLTDEQRRARSLLVTVEKVKTGFVYDYYNFSTPEPNTHWGYLQLMTRDFVIETRQLEYRRQVVCFWDNLDLDPIEQLRCLVRKVARFAFNLGLEIQPGEQPDNAIEVTQAAEFNADTDDPRIIPTALITSIWYKIDTGRSAFVTIDWQGYAYNDCQFPPPSPAEGGAAPARGESGPGSGGGTGGGGGTRTNSGPPSSQVGDPSSDSSGPSTGNSVPPSPGETEPFVPPPRGKYRVTTRIQLPNSSSAPCTEGQIFTNEDVVDPGPALLEKVSEAEGGYGWKLYDADANLLRNVAGSSARAECEIVVTIVSQVRIDV